MAYTFPVLTVQPSVDLDEEYEDARIKSSFENGSELMRPKYTKNRRTFTTRYDLLPNVDKESLASFYEADLEYGTYTFTWVHPKTSVAYGVRFVDPLKFTYIYDTDDGYWKTEIKVREV
jgi:hypothetical protein